MGTSTAAWVSAFAEVGTFVVIAATAIAALVQLRHIRSANQLTGLLRFSAIFESDETQNANVFIAHQLADKLRDNGFVRTLLEANPDRRLHPELHVCDFLEQQGSYIKFGMIERRQYLDLVGWYVSSMWQALREVVALRRFACDDGSIYENFEYLASLSARCKPKPRRYSRGADVLMPEKQWRELAKHSMISAEPGDVGVAGTTTEPEV